MEIDALSPKIVSFFISRLVVVQFCFFGYKMRENATILRYNRKYVILMEIYALSPKMMSVSSNHV
jgi:hypothetical protein